MAQKTFAAGDVLTASDVNTYLSGEGGAWTTWTPTLYQSNTLTATVNATWTRAKYARFGRLIAFDIVASVSATGTANNLVGISLPVTAALTASTFGSGILYDSSAIVYYPFICALFSGTTTIMTFPSTATNAADPRIGLSQFTAALASGDAIGVSGVYEAAS